MEGADRCDTIFTSRKEFDQRSIFTYMYLFASFALLLIYLLEILIFMMVFFTVRSLLRYLDKQTYNSLKLPFFFFMLFTIGFMFYRVAFFIILQF